MPSTGVHPLSQSSLKVLLRIGSPKLFSLPQSAFPTETSVKALIYSFPDSCFLPPDHPGAFSCGPAWHGRPSSLQSWSGSFFLSLSFSCVSSLFYFLNLVIYLKVFGSFYSPTHHLYTVLCIQGINDDGGVHSPLVAPCDRPSHIYHDITLLYLK